MLSCDLSQPMTMLHPRQACRRQPGGDPDHTEKGSSPIGCQLYDTEGAGTQHLDGVILGVTGQGVEVGVLVLQGSVCCHLTCHRA